MANTKITDLTANTAPASGDLINHVDISDTSMAATGTNKKSTLANAVTKGHGLSDGVVKVSSGTMAVATAGTDYTTPSSTESFTNKTFNANGTGNSISNIEVADFAAGVVDTDISSVSASDDTLPSAKATKTYVDGKVSDTAYGVGWNGDTTTAPSKNAVYDKIETLGGTSPFTLEATGEVTGSAAAICTASGLDLDTDKVYLVIAYINCASGGNPILGWQINSDTTAGNYRYIRISSDGTTVTTSRVSSNNWGTDVNAGDTLCLQFMISKKASNEVWGETGIIPYGTIGSQNMRQFGIAWTGTANVTSLSIIDGSGSSYLDVGTKIKVYSMGF